MTDPFSITAGVIGITTPALHGARLLLDDLQKISEAPEVVKHLEEDLRSVELALQSLQAISEPQWAALGEGVVRQSKVAISTCTESCKGLKADLESWTRHSEDGKLSWQDRTNVGFFKQSRIKSMSEQLQSYKLTLNSVVSSATFQSSLSQIRISEEIKTTLIQKEAEITNSITRSDKQLAELKTRLEKINLVRQDETVSMQDQVVMREQIEQEKTVLMASLKLFEEIRSRNKEEAKERVAQIDQTRSTNVTFGSDNSGFQIGVSNGSISGISFGAKGS